MSESAPRYRILSRSIQAGQGVPRSDVLNAFQAFEIGTGTAIRPDDTNAVGRVPLNDRRVGPEKVRRRRTAANRMEKRRGRPGRRPLVPLSCSKKGGALRLHRAAAAEVNLPADEQQQGHDGHAPFGDRGNPWLYARRIDVGTG